MTFARLSFARLAYVILLHIGVSAAAHATPLKVVASFSILADMVARVAGPDATISTLVGPGADAHVYRPTPQDAKTLREADLVFVNGLGFEGFMPRLVKSSGTKAPLITVSTGVNARKAEDEDDDHHGKKDDHHDHGALDPHAWQSLANAKRYVENIRDAFIKADAAHAEGYIARASAYLAEIDALKQEMTTAFAAIPREKRVFVTSHDALGYFGAEFGFDLHPIQGLSTEAEPTAKQVARISKLVQQKKARAIFVESIRSPRLAAELARETGAKVGGTLYSDALTDEKGEAPTYIAMMRHNTRALVAALKD